MIQKTLSTFTLSSVILANQYRIEVDNNRRTIFIKLINLLWVAERHNEVLVNNNARAPGKKKIPEANHGKKGHRERGHRRGGHSNTWSRDVNSGPSGRGNTVEKTYKNPTPKKVENGNAPCYMCGVSVHWYQQCKDSAKVASSYKKYRESIDQEAHCVEEHDHAPDVNFTISDFQGNKNHALMETSDFG
ncbi:uncharacterized protein LOC113331926 [Papaver somniferum]|uniref:uncharacterized protein LOC113331926 n=1 Tax=Papaver somniferum TaxID=3469 RepID=UPI000E6FA486|nr:uncharacterized protein LOC113331926 [Papaver somniferum]